MIVSLSDDDLEKAKQVLTTELRKQLTPSYRKKLMQLLEVEHELTIREDQ